MLRVSATHLESFRLYHADVIDESDLIASVRGEQRQTPEMQFGRVFHYLVEHPQLNLYGYYERDGLCFAPAAIDAVLGRLDPRGVFEVRCAKTVGQTREGDELVLVAKADHITGLDIAELKTKLDGSFDPERYADSYQWRVMVLLFGAVRITYHVARLDDEDADAVYTGGSERVYVLKHLESMDLYPYPALESDVRELVREFCRWLRHRKLDEFLRREYPTKAVSA